jgi:hypothetical protein
MEYKDFLCCEYCLGGPKKSYRDGFTRDIIKSGKYELTPESIGFLGVLFTGTFEDMGFIRFTIGKSYSGAHSSSYCSLSCLNQRHRIKNLAENMNDSDRDYILKYFPIEPDTIKPNPCKLEVVKPLEPRMLDDITVLKEEIEIQKEIIRNIHAEERMKDSIEQIKQKEIDALLETIKDRDKEIFYLTTQLMELKKERISNSE